MPPGMEEPQGWVLPAGDEVGVPTIPPACPYGAMAPATPPPRGLGRAQPHGVPVLVEPQSGTTQQRSPGPPCPFTLQGCAFKTFCIYFAFYYL